MPNYKIKWDATGSADGSSWINAFTTISAGITAAANTGDVLEVSGGSSGHTYTEALSMNKGVEIKQSTESGHSGTVIVEGYKDFNNSGTGGTIILRGIEAQFDALTNRAFRVQNGANFEIIDVFWSEMLTTNNTPRIEGGTGIWTRCRFANAYASSTSYASLLIFAYLNAATMTFNYCLFDNASGFINVNVSGGTWKYNNCIWIAPNPKIDFEQYAFIFGAYNVGVTWNNCSFFGCYPVKANASTTGMIANNCYYHAGDDGSITSFDDQGITTENNCVYGIDPQLQDIAHNDMGEFIVRIDDVDNSDDAVTTAATLNPEVVLSLAIECHGGNKTPTQQQVEDFRTLINSNNEVLSHGGSHSDFSDMSAITISATGTTPIVNISGTRSGDSTTWTGTLTVTINSVPQNFDLASASYDELSELIASLNGASIGDGTVTAVKANSQHSDKSLSVMLADVTSLSISSSQTLSFNETAFVTAECSEAIDDLQAYIRTGSDRNSSNASGAGAASGASATYTVRTFASPYGQGSTALGTSVQNNSQIWGGNQTTGATPSQNVYVTGSGFTFNMYDFQYVTHDNSDDAETFMRAVTCAISTTVSSPLRHGIPTYNGSLANLKTLLQNFGLGSQRFMDVLSTIRTSGDWNISEPNASFTGTKEDYFYKGDLNLTVNSPLKDTGLNSVWQGTPDVVDYIGNIITDGSGDIVASGGIVDIGFLEFEEIPEETDTSTKRTSNPKINIQLLPV